MLLVPGWFQTTPAQQNSKTSRPSVLRNLRLRIPPLPHHHPRKRICNNCGRERCNSSFGPNSLTIGTRYHAVVDSVRTVGRAEPRITTQVVGSALDGRSNATCRELRNDLPDAIV